jgi:hypothetical protein
MQRPGMASKGADAPDQRGPALIPRYGAPSIDATPRLRMTRLRRAASVGRVDPACCSGPLPLSATPKRG